MTSCLGPCQLLLLDGREVTVCLGASPRAPGTQAAWALWTCRMCPGCVRACGHLVSEASQEISDQPSVSWEQG